MNRIAELRRARGMSQRELAHKLGTHPVNLGRYEREDRRLTLPVLLKLGEIFDVSIGEIAGEKRSPRRAEGEETATEYMQRVMRDPAADEARRDAMAKALAAKSASLDDVHAEMRQRMKDARERFRRKLARYMPKQPDQPDPESGLGGGDGGGA